MVIIMKIALQLYSIHQEVERDFFGTLKKVAAMGYDGVEFAGYFGNSAADVKKELDKLGLVSVGTHNMFDNPGTYKENLEFEKELNTCGLVVPWHTIESEDDVNALVKKMKELASYYTPHGFKVGYHNHNQEFKTFGGKYALDILFEQVPELICEIDVYWVKFAGVDPVEYLKKYNGRIPLIHLKDMEKNNNKKSTEIGSGSLDMPAIIKTAGECGTEWLIVEQEEYSKYTPMESAKISYDYIKSELS
ncbi:MAG: sugar phosphate isomerase/epimerase [Oscillospiraceae bacterium]|nr:sugar phosphate isomerase/epimerase [Oscillospiraceae bacterium]